MRTIFLLAISTLAIGMAALLPGNTNPANHATSASALVAISGDIDCSGEVTSADALAGMRALAGLGGHDCLVSSGDVNCSGGSPDMGDLLLLRRHVAGLSVTLPPGCPAIGEPVDPGDPGNEGKTSAELIEAARARGELTEGQALLYHVYADLAINALPARYRGGLEPGIESVIFDTIALAWPRLSTSERTALHPFLLPPAAEGSWVNAAENEFAAQAIEWDTVSNAHVKVWWQTRRPEDEAKAVAILAEMEATIWPKVVGYMGQEHAPLSDAGYPTSGGDGKYDIYLVHNAPDKPGEYPVLGWVSPLIDAAGDYKCEMSPTYMALNSRVALTPTFFSTLAHEFMHSVQFTYDVGSCDDYGWLEESTSMWVESWLYPDVNAEHGYAAPYLENLQQPLEQWIYKDYHQYGSYLFWYFLEHKAGLPNAVRDTWAASGSPDSLAAVQAATAGAGGLKELWPESALYNWNRPPFEDFMELDGLVAAARWKDTEVQAGNRPVSYPVPTTLGHMQQNHLHYSMLDGVKSLAFINPFFLSGEPNAKVQALLNIDGQWEAEPRDWTNDARQSFCFDRPGENVDELVIIITNSNYSDRSHTFNVGDGELVASPLGCKEWTGSASAEINYFDAKYTVTVDNMRFEPQPGSLPGNGRYDFYDLVETGSVTWHVSGTWPGGCTASGTMSLEQPGAPNGVRGDITIDREQSTYYIHVNGHRDGATHTITCGTDSWEQVWPALSVTWNGGLTNTPMKDEGGVFVLDAEYLEPSPAFGGRWTWRFTELE